MMQKLTFIFFKWQNSLKCSPCFIKVSSFSAKVMSLTRTARTAARRGLKCETQRVGFFSRPVDQPGFQGQSVRTVTWQIVFRHDSYQKTPIEMIFVSKQKYDRKKTIKNTQLLDETHNYWIKPQEEPHCLHRKKNIGPGGWGLWARPTWGSHGRRLGSSSLFFFFFFRVVSTKENATRIETFGNQPDQRHVSFFSFFWLPKLPVFSVSTNHFKPISGGVITTAPRSGAWRIQARKPEVVFTTLFS